MKTNNIRHQVFIREMIAHGNRQQAYQTAYPECTSPVSAYKSAGRLLAHPLIRNEIQKAAEVLHSRAMENMEDDIRIKCLTMLEKRIWLARIAHGDKIFPQVRHRKGKLAVEYKPATPKQLLDAIELDTKLEIAMQALDY